MMSGLSSQYSSLTQQASMLRGQSDYYSALGGVGFSIANMAAGQVNLSSLSGLSQGTSVPPTEEQLRLN